MERAASPGSVDCLAREKPRRFYPWPEGGASILESRAARGLGSGLEDDSWPARYGVLLGLAFGCRHLSTRSAPENLAVLERASNHAFDEEIDARSKALFKEGREVFRYDTFGSQDFWGGKLRLHEAIAGQEHGGIGPGLTPKQALELGLKVDSQKLTRILIQAIKGSTVSLDKVNTTLEILKANAVVGITGFFDDPKDSWRLTSVGIQCAFCHSTVDDSFKKGIGHRLDGWPNRDLNVGQIVALAPTLKPFEDLLKLDDASIRKVLKSWGPGRYDAELDKDGKATRPDGKTAATLLPPA
jgi:hypothetical protein